MIFCASESRRRSIRGFPIHLNNKQPNIKFTVEGDTLSILHVLVTRKSDGKSEHKVFKKPSHTDFNDYTKSRNNKNR